MKKMLIVNATNLTNKYGLRFTERALEGSMWEACDTGYPTLISHDHSRPLGWAFPTALHIEPHTVRAIATNFMMDSKDDLEKIMNWRENFTVKMYYRKRTIIEKLKTLLEDKLIGIPQIVYYPTVSFVEDNLAVRVFPEIFALRDNDKRDGLVSLENLNPIGPGVFQIGELVIFAHKFFRRSLYQLNTLNSDFLRLLQDLDNSLSPKIALDPHMIGLASDYAEPMELMYWRGPKFKDDLTSIPPDVTEYQSTEEQRFWLGMSRTEFWWKKDTTHHSLEIEEIADLPILQSDEIVEDKFGCRFVHSMVQANDGVINHLDGAIRMYSEVGMLERIDKSINHAGKHSEYTKLWRIDGQISLAMWKSLIANYFRDNILVSEYLGGIDDNPYLVQKAAKDNVIPPKFTYVPYSMSSGDGIRISISYRWENKEIVQEPFTHQISALDHLGENNEEMLPIIDSKVIDLKKLLQRLGAEVEISEKIEYVKFQDGYANFPLILHSNNNLPNHLQRTHSAIKQIVSQWNLRGIDISLTYSIGFRVDNRLVTVSVIGHSVDIAKWLDSKLSHIPYAQKDLSNWVKAVSQYVSKNSSLQTYYPLWEILMDTGLYSIKRKPLDSEWEYFSSDEGLGFRFDLSPYDNELIRLLDNGEIFATSVALIKNTRCTGCGTDYRKCTCSKLLDDDVSMEIIDFDLLSPIWTDKH